jgi:hypothetical protein
MEPWEIELEFYTYDEYEKASSGQGEFHKTEEFSMDDSDFKESAAEIGGFDDTEWEEVK